MGLDTSHGCWHGAYSAFMRWREKLAEVAGYPPLIMMAGFYNPDSWWFMTKRPDVTNPTMYKFTPELDGLSFDAQCAMARLPIGWALFEKDPLHLLLRHSDCDGSIASADCGPIADRIESLLPKLPTGDGGGHIGDWRAKTQAFIDGLRVAAASGEDVEFH